MADRKNIENKIKESFEAQNRKAPKNLWGNLSSKLEDSNVDGIDAKVRDSFEGLDGSAPNHLWGNINIQLNIDRTWGRIKRVLDWRTTLKRWSRVAAIALLLLAVGWNGYRYFSGIPEKDDVVSLNSKEMPITNNDNRHEKILADKIIAGNSMNEDKSTTTSSANNTTQPANMAGFKEPAKRENITKIVAQNEPSVSHNISFTGKDKNTGNIQPDAVAPEQMALLPAFIEVGADSIDALTSYYENDFVPEKRRKKRQFDVGPIYSYNNTWLLNNETKKSFDRRSLVSSTAAFAASYGLAGSYSISDKNAVSAFLYVHSTTKQHYQTYIEGRYADKSRTMDYAKVALAYQRNLYGHIPAMPTKYTVKLGMYFAYLKKATLAYNEVDYSVTNNYTNTDYGLVLQAGQEVEKGRFVIGYGLNAEKGLKNIFAGDERTPIDFDKTTTLSIGAYLSARYKF